MPLYGDAMPVSPERLRQLALTMADHVDNAEEVRLRFWAGLPVRLASTRRRHREVRADQLLADVDALRDAPPVAGRPALAVYLGAARDDIQDADVKIEIGAVLAELDAEVEAARQDQDRLVEPGKPTHHLWCDRDPAWTGLKKALEREAGVIVIPGSVAEGHDYFVERVKRYAARLRPAGELPVAALVITWPGNAWPTTASACIAHLERVLAGLGFSEGDLGKRFHDASRDNVLVLVFPCVDASRASERSVAVDCHTDLARTLRLRVVPRVQPVSWPVVSGWRAWLRFPAAQDQGFVRSLAANLDAELLRGATPLPPLDPIGEDDLMAFSGNYLREEERSAFLDNVWAPGAPSRALLERVQRYLEAHPNCLKEREP